MALRPPRNVLIPNANSPRLLARVMELIGQGVREPRSLAEILDCELRTVHYYSQAGEWLGLTTTDAVGGRLQLTELGLEYVFAGPDRPRVYAQAVWANDFVVQLMTGRDELPDAEALGRFIQQWVPDMAEATARRRASAVRSLLEPALRLGPRRPKAQQLSLDFGPDQVAKPPEEKLPPRLVGPESPDVYRLVLRALLDHGELSLGHLRAVLDKGGAEGVAVGGYAEMAVRRGDAFRVGDRLVGSWGAVWRRELAETVAGVALSDPRYREYLDNMRQAASGHPGAAVRYGQLRERFTSWDRRVFGETVTPSRLVKDLERVLLGRSIDDFPIAGETGPEPSGQTGSFLELQDQEGLFFALPTNLTALAGGVAEANRLLERARQAKNGVGLPRVTDRRELVHGGVYATGEPQGRSIPDQVTLRLRAVSNVPHLALITALLILHRRPGWRRVLRLRDGSLELWRGRKRVGELLLLLDELCSEQGWLVIRRPRAGVTGEQLAEILQGLGVARRVGDQLVLDEAFFVRLQTEVEDRQVYDLLQPLADRAQRFVEAWEEAV
ncbi:hypothetical protein L6R49_03615 [Myxococcota bacterium]|nr:hypothetical protein [Myxococcota bacterium]